MYRCKECGNLFEEGEQATWQESRGEFWGNPCTENMSGCPLCKGNYEETSKCICCGNENFLEEELENGVCNECIEKHTKDFDFCIKAGEEARENVKINGAVLSIWSADEINEILIEELKKIKNISFEKFVQEDKFWFAEMIEKEVQLNE